jgi:opacity protein-like surface antigen
MILLLLSGVPAFAQAAAGRQTAELPRWDFNVSAGFFESRPFDVSDPFTGDDWYGEGRYAASIGYNWTEHFRTELEFAHTGEGRRWIQEFVTSPGTSIRHSIGTEVFHRLQQTSARAVWQFNDNTWVHPYLNGGVVLDAERRMWQSPAQFYYPPYNPNDPRGRPPILVRPEVGRGSKVMEYRTGVTLGGGSKFYMSTNAYLNAGMQVTYAKPAVTAAVLVGFGVEF